MSEPAESERSPAPMIREMLPEARDLASFAACFEKNGSPRSPDLLHWQYLGNPTGRLYVDFAIGAEGQLAAIYASLPVRMRVRGEVVLGMQSVDTITDSEFRGRGLFLRLANRTYQRAANEGVKLVYGFPNGSSAHGFFERLGWTNLDPLPFLIRPLRTRYVLEQLKLRRLAEALPNVRLFFARSGAKRRDIRTIESFDERATNLWREAAGKIGIAVERNADYLNWRLVHKPGESYVNTGIFDGDRLLAFVSHAVKNKHGGRIGYIMESLCVPGHERDLRVLMTAALANMVEEGADVALAWCFPHSATFAAFLRTGFVPLPTSLRPIELHVGARSFAGDEPFVSARRNWYVSYLDADTT